MYREQKRYSIFISISDMQKVDKEPKRILFEYDTIEEVSNFLKMAEEGLFVLPYESKQYCIVDRWCGDNGGV